MIYTEEIHRNILRTMLSKHDEGEKLENLCPAAISGKDQGSNVCEMCNTFLDMGDPTQWWDGCPCYSLGKEEVLKRAKEKLGISV